MTINPLTTTETYSATESAEKERSDKTMATQASVEAVDHEAFFPDPSELITEDDTPVDNFPSAKQQRLLVGSLYSTLSDTLFLAEANVGVYHTFTQPPIVPDVFVSFDVEVPENWWDKANRCYLVWNFGKPPEIAIEIVSNQVGNELERKKSIYEHMRVSYYALYDPSHQLGEKTLRLFELRGRRYAEVSDHWMEQVNLGLTLWEGEFEGRSGTWLRWCDKSGQILTTGDENTQEARAQTEVERQRAEAEKQRAEAEKQRADRLAAILKEKGIDITDL